MLTHPHSHREVLTDVHIHTYSLRLYAVVYSYADACINTITTQWRRATQFLEKYTSHFIWKGCVWEGVGDRTELQHIDSLSIGHNRVSFPFSCAAQPGAWGPTLLGAGFLYRILSPTGLFSKLVWSPTGPVSKLTDFLSSPSYIIVQRPFFLWASQLHSFNPSTVKVIILIFLDRMHLLFT